jgi:hypothetical protein
MALNIAHAYRRHTFDAGLKSNLYVTRVEARAEAALYVIKIDAQAESYTSPQGRRASK